MFILYFLALIPIIIYAYLYYKNYSVNIVEFLGCSILCLVVAGIFHYGIHKYITSDVEVLSGQITTATFHPEWVERYSVAIYKTQTYMTGCGKTRHMATRQVFSHYETRYRTHYKYWSCNTSLDFEKEISKEFFDEISKNFRNITTENPGKSGFHSGDKNIYVSYNTTGYIYPVTTTQNWENRLKCSKTVFSYPSIPKDVKVFEYPVPENWKQSNRLINESDVSILEFDRLNAVLGLIKQVNVILINFGDSNDPMIAKYQEAKYFGGKKNDVVICYGNKNNGIPEWSYVFSWSENSLVKRNLETMFTSYKINDDILPLIEQEIKTNFKIKDWHKFDYITIYPTTNSIILYILICILINGGLIYYVLNNNYDKEYDMPSSYRY